MKLVALILALALAGCSSGNYPLKTTKLKLISPNMTMAQAADAPVLTIFSQQQGILAMVCGAVVQYQNGQPANMISGNCTTPMAMIAAAMAPVTLGLGAAVWAAP